MIDQYYSLEDESYPRIRAAHDEAIKDISPELVVKDLDRITKTILDSIKIGTDDAEILALQIKLLSIALNCELRDKLHISFTKTLSELSSDQVTILHNIHNSNYEFIEICDYDKGKGFFNYEFQRYDYPKNELNNPEDFLFDIFYLQEILKIIQWPIYKQDPIIENNEQVGLVQYSKLIETEYGVKFNSCLFD